jgi:hypothetical protein
MRRALEYKPSPLYTPSCRWTPVQKPRRPVQQPRRPSQQLNRPAQQINRPTRQLRRPSPQQDCFIIVGINVKGKFVAAAKSKRPKSEVVFA